MSILAEQRKKVILEQLKDSGQVKVIHLAKKLSVSEETVRRDLHNLEQDGLLKRVYGGAVTQKSPGNYEPPYLQRQAIHAEEKKAIGQCAASLVKSGDTIAIDVGTTTLEFAKSLSGLQQLTVLTNSLAVAFCLMEALNAGRISGKVIVIGGELSPQQQSLSGTASELMMRPFTVDKTFLSAGGISLDRGISDFDIHESSMSRLFAESAKEVIVLADRSKLGENAFVQIIPLEEADLIVSSGPPPEEWLPYLDTFHVNWTEA